MNSPFILNVRNSPLYALFTTMASNYQDAIIYMGTLKCHLVDVHQGPLKSMDETSENHPPVKQLSLIWFWKFLKIFSPSRLC
jgi:hypothetical protein